MEPCREHYCGVHGRSIGLMTEVEADKGGHTSLSTEWLDRHDNPEKDAK